MSSTVEIGIIGGSGLYDMAELTDREDQTCEREEAHRNSISDCEHELHPDQGRQTLLSQLGVADGQSLSWMHCTHAAWPCWVSQNGRVRSLQSVLTTQIAHLPRSVSQTGAAVGQSALWRHAAHALVTVLHSGVVPPQPALSVQPARHAKSCGSQIGCAVPQSEFARQLTQV